jgi:DNA-nicking Smr family endonuclease
MDAKSFGKMKKGKLHPEARIDLHGMTLDEAHPALLGFILQSQAMGRRLVLVITGKGKLRDELAPMPVRQGVLRHQVPHWLNMTPLRPLILQITPAHISHGGSGAYYVYLKRGR